ncbi:MAG: type II toxin-antitoxin system RelE/ParE family toxin [Deltaproteobacteria bacterium]|nr:type II toxin-antitoxin system RelE/ParE family toxin [Deltaproteobacteria bacterium]
MSFRVELESRARREFLELPKEVQKRFTDVIDDLQSNPRPPGAKRLTGLEGYRIRKGDYRLLYTVDDQNSIIRIYRIGHRREVYR